MISADQGWALDGQVLLWTVDGGESWRDITPPIGADLDIVDVFFLNADLGRVALSQFLTGEQGILPVQIMRTEDGGQS